MKARKFAKDLMIAITEDDAPEGFEIIEEGDWVQDHKYQCREIVFKFEEKCYSLNESRSGSYHSDWYYESDDWGDEVDAYEVEPVETKTVVWRAVA